MKQILLVNSILMMLTLSGCTVAPSMLGNNIAGIGGSAVNTPGSQTSMAAGSPNSTGSIVPLNEEGAVVDLPDSSAQKQVSSGPQEGQPAFVEEGVAGTQSEQASSAQERHRRELINRGDLQEGQSLPVE